MKANFEVDKQEDGRSYTAPGVIDIFKVEEVIFGESEKGKEYFEYTFGRTQDMLKHRFYVSTDHGQARLKNLFGKLTDDTFVPDENKIIALTTGKSLALKVTGKVDEQTGKGYNDVPFFNFCKKVNDIAELVFSNKDLESINDANEARAKTSGSKSDQPSLSDQTENKANADKF